MYKEVTQIVKSNEIKDLTPDLIEAVLDNKMTDGILKEIQLLNL